MSYSATFSFDDDLKELISKTSSCKKRYEFTNHPSIKDSIEAQGIPHTEVGKIIVNGEEVDFSYPLQHNDQIQVFGNKAIPALIKFVADTHLGKLARDLRLLGFDTLYENTYKDTQLVDISVRDNRILLSRDIKLLQRKQLKLGYYLRSQFPQMQLIEVIKRFDLTEKLDPFSRCISCNGIIKQVPKKEVLDKLEPKTKKYFDEFYRCNTCGKIYWEGSHYKKMIQRIEQLKSTIAPPDINQ